MPGKEVNEAPTRLAFDIVVDLNYKLKAQEAQTANFRN
jgi:hypothetical protein